MNLVKYYNIYYRLNEKGFRFDMVVKSLLNQHETCLTVVFGEVESQPYVSAVSSTATHAS